MCRLIAYLGHEVLLQNVLVDPVNSLIKQSLKARESEYPTNGDGFGVGWYAPQIDETPALFTSIFPAWNDRNLLNLAAKIESPCFFGHVRAASAGGVTPYNCHPFVNGKWMFMHNGSINDFIQIKRHIRHLLDDDVYNWIKGDTDSEHIFALFIQMSKGRDLTAFDAVAQLTHDVFGKLHQVMAEFGTLGNSFLNICITDGTRILATRYCSDKRFKPESMHYAIGNRYVLKNKEYRMLRQKGPPQCVLVASEMLNDFSKDWKEIPEHHILMVKENLEFDIRPL